MTLNNKNIIVVGASGLLGFSLVHHLLSCGSKVHAVDRDLDKLLQKIDGIATPFSDNLDVTQLDILDDKAVRHFFSSLGDVDGLVNCAYPRNGSYGSHFFDVSLPSFNENLNLNLGSSFLLMQECARYFNSRLKPFSLVNISSIYGVVTPKFEIYNLTKMTTPVEYVAIKSALINLSKYVVKYVCNSDFRINLVSPGGIYDNQPSSFLDAYRKNTLGKGMLDAEDIMGAIAFLLSDESKFINGQNVIVDDGFSL